MKKARFDQKTVRGEQVPQPVREKRSLSTPPDTVINTSRSHEINRENLRPPNDRSRFDSQRSRDKGDRNKGRPLRIRLKRRSTQTGPAIVWQRKAITGLLFGAVAFGVVRIDRVPTATQTDGSRIARVVGRSTKTNRRNECQKEGSETRDDRRSTVHSFRLYQSKDRMPRPVFDPAGL